MENNKKVTSDDVASLAAKVLSNPDSSDIAKKMAGSALSQKQSQHQTGTQIEDVASKVLKSDKYSGITKTLAASILSQSNKKR